MATLIPSSFCRYELSPAELQEGSIFNALQKYVLQNVLSDTAEERNALKFTPDNIAAFQQREAELTGQMGIIKYLLALSDEAESNLKSSNTNSEE